MNANILDECYVICFLLLYLYWTTRGLWSWRTRPDGKEYELICPTFERDLGAIHPEESQQIPPVLMHFDARIPRFLCTDSGHLTIFPKSHANERRDGGDSRCVAPMADSELLEPELIKPPAMRLSGPCCFDPNICGLAHQPIFGDEHLAETAISENLTLMFEYLW